MAGPGGAAPGPADGASQTITRYARPVGNINFATTGGSLRTQANTGDACAIGASSTAAVASISQQARRSPRRIPLLGWIADWEPRSTRALLRAQRYCDSRDSTTTFNNGGTLFPYFGGFRADVTARVAGNGNYTFSGLTVNTGAPHCGSQAVVAGWGLVVIYQRAAEDLRAINVFDGLQFFRGGSVTLTPDGFRVPVAPINGKMAIVAWKATRRIRHR